MESVKSCQQEIQTLMKNLQNKFDNEFADGISKLDQKINENERVKIANQLEYQK